MTTILAIILVPVLFVVASLAVDIGHVAMVRTELQNAADAAALAGAHDIDLSPSKVQTRAETVAGFNTADGQPVSKTTPGTNVVVVFTPPSGSDSGLVEVTVSRRVRHFFASLIGRTSDVISVQASASASGRVVELYDGIAFPLAFSVDAHTTATNNGNGNGNDNGNDNGNGNGNDGNGNGNSSTAVSLNDLTIGSTVRLVVATEDTSKSNNGNGNGNAYAYGQNKKHDTYINAAFIQFSQSGSTGALEQALGLSDWQAGVIPAVNVGDQLLLNDVEGAQAKMSQTSYASALLLHTKIVPVVTGDPTNVQGHQVIGFVAINFTAIGLDSSNQKLNYVEGTVVKAAVPGQRTSSNQAVQTSGYDAALERLSPEPVRLVYNN